MRSAQGAAGEELALFRRWKHDGDGAAREQLVARFSSLSRTLARRYRNTSEPMEDLYQVAQLGLVKAIDRYDPDRGFHFSTYAIPTILGELRRYFRSASWAAHVPRAAQERALQVRDAERALTDERRLLAHGLRVGAVHGAERRGGPRRDAGHCTRWARSRWMPLAAAMRPTRTAPSRTRSASRTPASSSSNWVPT